MKKNWIVVIALAAALLVPTVGRAHEHDKTVMGTVSTIDGNNLTVKTAEGKSVMVMMDTKTKITKGATKLPRHSCLRRFTQLVQRRLEARRQLVRRPRPPVVQEVDGRPRVNHVMVDGHHVDAVL